MKRFCLCLLLLVMVFPYWPALAQPDPPDTSNWQTYTSENGLLTARLPESWVAQDEPDGLPGIVVASSPIGFSRYDGDLGILRSGDYLISFVLMPFEIMPILKVDVTAQTSQSDLILRFGNYFIDENEAVIYTPVKLEKPDGSRITLLRLRAEETGESGFMIALPMADEFFIYALALTVSEDYNDALEAILLEIIFSVEYSGTLDDLLDQYGM